MIDDGFYLAGFKKRQDIFSKILGDNRFLCVCLRPQCGARYGDALADDGTHIELCSGSEQEGDDDIAAVVRQDVDVFLHVGSRDHVEDEIRAVAIAGFDGNSLPVLLAVIHREIGPQFDAELAFLVVACSDQHLAAVGLGKLYGGGANAAGAAVNEYGFSFGEGATGTEPE